MSYNTDQGMHYQDNNTHVFKYPNGIEDLASLFGHRSNSIGATFLAGVKARTDDTMAQAFEGSIVSFVSRNNCNYPTIGTPLGRDLYEKLAFRIKLIFSGDNVLIGKIVRTEEDEFAITSSNSINQYLYFSLLQKGGE